MYTYIHIYSSQRLNSTVHVFSLIVICNENIFLLEMMTTVAFHWLTGTSTSSVVAEKQRECGYFSIHYLFATQLWGVKGINLLPLKTNNISVDNLSNWWLLGDTKKYSKQDWTKLQRALRKQIYPLTVKSVISYPYTHPHRWYISHTL